jgi:uncharacterized protein
MAPVSMLLVTSALADLTGLENRVIVGLSGSPRYTKLPSFDPHRKDFTCVYESQHVPPVDPQAEMWFQQAVAMNDP